MSRSTQNERMSAMMQAGAQAQPARAGNLTKMPDTRPRPVRQFNTRLNDDTRKLLTELVRELQDAGHSEAHAYVVLDALLFALGNESHRQYTLHLMGLRGPLDSQELAGLL